MDVISESEWVWCGYAGHFVGGSRCRFHLNTRVGRVRVSTVGDYHPTGSLPEEEPVEIGFGRTYETYVFVVDGDCEGTVDTYEEIDSEGYNSSEDADAGHLAMCRKWAINNELTGGS